VAVGAEHLQVLDPVVVIDTVDVMQTEGQRRSTPLGETALVATVLEEPQPNETLLEVPAERMFASLPDGNAASRELRD
jgi:hypothetical protein